MKRMKRLLFSGIRRKIFNLILITVALLTFAYMALSQLHMRMLTQLVSDTTEKQQESISETTSTVMGQTVRQTLGRANKTEARIANEMFDAAGNRVEMIKEYAERILANPGDYSARHFSGPNPADDGTWTAKVIFAKDTDPSDPALKEKIGLLANLFDAMTTLCPAYGGANLYIGLPEGAHLTVSNKSSSWFEDGVLIDYDPRNRDWYQKATEKGKMIYTEGEEDATTGEYCIECAAPIYGPDGSLQAVVGSDVFLTEMQEVFRDSSVEGEYALLVNQSGHAVIEQQEEEFPMAESDRGGDLRESSVPMLAQVIENALEGKGTSVVLGELEGGMYYVTANPIKSTGWSLVSAYSQEVAEKAANSLQGNLEGIQNGSQATYREKTAVFRRIVLGTLLGIVALTLWGALTLGRRIVRPLGKITRRISALSGENMVFEMEDTYRTGDEVEELAESFSLLSHRAAKYMDEVVRVTAEKERIGAELSLATEIQAAMLPHIFPAFPNRPDFDIYASMDPAKEVGGDFYDYFLVDNDHLCMVIADVSGKGIPAALFMMASKIILQSVAMLGNTPAEILTKTNEALCSNNEAEMFVTVWLGILELSTGKLTAANAGHEYPVLKSPDGPFELYKDKHGFVVGGMDGLKYKDYELHLDPGAKLFLYTDGVPEATNAQNELFGTERMVDALNAAADASPEGVLKNMRESVDRFVEEAEQFDDLTMLCFEYIGPLSGMTEQSESP